MIVLGVCFELIVNVGVLGFVEIVEKDVFVL